MLQTWRCLNREWGSSSRDDLLVIEQVVDDATVLGNEGTEDEGADGGELDEDVDGWAGGVLERIADGVTSDGSGVSLSSLSDNLSVDDELASLNVLLGIVPSATGVGGGEGDLDARDDATGKDSVGGLVAEEAAGEEWGDDDEETWGDHLLEGGLSGDANAVLVVGELLIGVSSGLLGLLHLVELSLDLGKHVLGGITDGLHGHGGEPVWEHGADEETSEGEWLEDVHVEGFVAISTLSSDGDSSAGNEGTEEGQSDEAGRADGETLADSSGGVSSGIEIVSGLADARVEVGHLSDSTGVVRDWAIAVDGEGDWEASQHANGGKSDTVHGGEVEGDQDGDSEAEDGHNGGEVAEGESVDDVGGGTVSAGNGEVTSWGVLFGGVVLGDEADKETGPEAEDNADVGFPSGGVVVLAGEPEAETLLREHVDGGDDHDGHEDGGDPELDLELELNLVGPDVGEELADEGSKDADSGHNEWEVDSLGLVAHDLGGGGDDEGSAGGLSEGSEKIGAHTGDVTNIVTDVVSNGAWVLGGVFLEAFADLAGQVSTDISSLGVDATADSAEEGDSGSTEAIARDELEEVLSLRGGLGVDGGLVGEDEDLEDHESEADKDKAEDLTALEGDLEASELVDVAKVGGLVVADGGDHHADVAAEHGGAGSDEEGEGGVGELVDAVPWHVDGAEDEHGEEGAEDGESAVFFFKEGDGALD